MANSLPVRAFIMLVCFSAVPSARSEEPQTADERRSVNEDALEHNAPTATTATTATTAPCWCPASERAPAAARKQDILTGSMSPIPLLGDVSLTTGATDLLSISLSSTQKSTLGTVAYNPWRLDEKARALWGLQFLAASDTEKLNGTLGVNYHWSFRSVLNRCFIGIETEAIEIIPNSGSPEEYNIKIGEAVDAHPLLWLLPRFTLGVQTFVKPFEPLTEAAGFFDGVAGNVALSWRGQLWLEIDLLGSLTLKPTSDGSDGYNQIFKAGATIIVIPPSISAAMGAKHYGQKYYDSDYQTGLGFGAYGSFLQCVHGERSAASCADGKVQEISGGVLTEVRVSNKLRPRLSLGVSNTSQALTDEVTSQVVLDVALQMAFALTSNAQ